MQGTLHDNVDAPVALKAQSITTNATFTGEILDLGGGDNRELLLVFTTGTFTLGGGTVNLAIFEADKNDMTGESQVGSNRAITTELVASTRTVYRYFAERHKRFIRFKVIFAGGTAHQLDVAAVAVHGGNATKGGIITLEATLADS